MPIMGSWRDPSGYPSAEAPISLFAWEFLRRNAEYQADYARLWGDLTQAERRAAFVREQTRRCRPVRWLEQQWGFTTSVPDASTQDGPAPSHPNPLDDEGILLAFNSSHSPPIVDGGFAGLELGLLHSIKNSDIYGGPTVDARAQRANDKLDHDKCAVEFDVSKPLKPQLERAETALREVQFWRGDKPKSRRALRSKYPAYLRVLDGQNAGASEEEIKAVVYPDSEHTYDEARKAFANAFNAAAALVAGGYRHLPFTEE